MIDFNIFKDDDFGENPFLNSIRNSLIPDVIIDNEGNSYSLEKAMSFCDLKDIAKKAKTNDWKWIRIKRENLEKKCILTNINIRYELNNNQNSECNFLEFKKHDGKIDVNSQDVLFETDFSSTDNFLVEAYKELPIYIEDESPIETKEEMTLGAYFHKGSNKNRCYPCVVLYRNRINEATIKIKNKICYESFSTIEHHLTIFVLVHELAHAFFNKDKNNSYSEKEIEECLANYAALLHARKRGGLFLMIGKLFVESQKSLTNKGYNYALKLFDNNFNPTLTGWWKWRYCCDVKDGKSYKALSSVSDLIDILDNKSLLID